MKRIKNLFIVYIILSIIFSNLIVLNTNAIGTTTIDLTGLVTGTDANHACIFKNTYDEISHWSECIICNSKIGIKKHTIVESWATSNPHCNNLCTVYCTDNCGYSYQYREPHVSRKNYKWTDQDWKHYATCANCGRWCDTPYCTKEDGTRITCTNLGTCTVCKHEYTAANHFASDGYCRLCGKHLYNPSLKSIVYSSDRKTITISYHIQPVVKMTFNSAHSHSNNGGYGVTNSAITNADGSIDITYVCTVTSYPFQLQMNLQPRMYFTVNGLTCLMHDSYINFYPDGTAPTISVTQKDVSTKDNWTTSKQFIVSGTESYSDGVYISMEDSNGNIIYPSSYTSVSNSKYSFSFIPQIEANTSSNFYIVVTDKSGNIKKNKISVSNVDGKAPTLISSKDYTSEWSKIKTITFDTIDNGVGNVSLGFNNQSDLQLLPNVNGIYSRTYNFVGDVYGSVTGAIYLQDSLGNITTETVKIGKIDNTSPTITDIKQSTSETESIFTITANDINTTLNASGSGITGYAIVKKGTTPTKYQTSNVLSVKQSGEYEIYVTDLVGNVTKSSSYTVDLKCSKTVNITWNDNANKDNLRPSNITLELYRNGTKINSVTLNNTTTTYTFTNLETYDSNGTLYSYSYKLIANDRYGVIVNNNQITCNYNASTFSVKIPNTITLNGNTGKANYTLTITGNLYGNDTLVIKPSPSFVMKDSSNISKLNVDVIQNTNTFNKTNLSSVSGILQTNKTNFAGAYTGVFNFTIKLTKSN